MPRMPSIKLENINSLNLLVDSKKPGNKGLFTFKSSQIGPTQFVYHRSGRSGQLDIMRFARHHKKPWLIASKKTPELTDPGVMEWIQSLEVPIKHKITK